MLRIGLALVDILVYLLFYLSFILFYLAPLNNAENKVLRVPWDYNLTKDWQQEYLPLDYDITQESRIQIEDIFVKNDLADVNLEKRLILLLAKVGDPIFIRIFKKEYLLEVWIRSGSEYQHLKDYDICTYSGDLGPKLKEGDRQAPEGFYRVAHSALNPNSKFHLSFNLGYPNSYDRGRQRTGSFLMIHGNCVSTGCYAMTDEKIEEIYKLLEEALKGGQKYVQVHAFPFRMSALNMMEHTDNVWYDFWVNLKEGYDYFEAEKLPPHIKVKNKQYTIHEANE